MLRFVAATALGFVLYQVLAYIHPPRKNNYRLSIGEVGIRFGRTSTVVAERFLLGLAAFVFSVILLSFHFFWHFDSIARYLENIILGLLCGPLLGIWLNSIIRLPPDRGLSRGQIIGGIGLIVLFVVGSIGNNGADLLQRYASQITSLKVAGVTELQFAERSRTGATPQAPPSPTAASPSGTGTTQNAVSFSPSQGLQFASHLARWFVDLDRSYLNSAAEPDAHKLLLSNSFAHEVLEPPLECLYWWSRTIPDDATSINGHLRAFAGIFRYFHDPKNLEHRKRFGESFVRQSGLLADDVKSFPSLVTEPLTRSGTCKGLLSSSTSAESIQMSLDAGEFEERPYLAIAHASLMAQLGQYPAAGAILYDWLNSRSQKGAKTAADEWFELRARSILATYTEEWLEKNEATVGTPVRNEHLNNLNILRQGFRTVLGQRLPSAHLPTVSTDSLMSLIVHSECQFSNLQDLKNNAQLMFFWRYLFTLYVTTELTYDLNRMLLPEYEDEPDVTTDSLRELKQLDLTCLVEYYNPQVLRAQIFEAYARNAILYSDAKRGSETDAAKEGRLDEATQIAEKGLELVKHSDRSSPPTHDAYMIRIAPNAAVATKEALTIDKRRLKALRDE